MRDFNDGGPDAFAHVAYMMADAMLKAREVSND